MDHDADTAELNIMGKFLDYAFELEPGDIWIPAHSNSLALVIAIERINTMRTRIFAIWPNGVLAHSSIASHAKVSMIKGSGWRSEEGS